MPPRLVVVQSRLSNSRSPAISASFFAQCDTRVARCPLWDKAIADIFDGDDTLLAYCDRYVGYSLSASGSSHSCATIWATSTTRRVGSNRLRIRSRRKCYPCLRSELLPMCPELTRCVWRPQRDLRPTAFRFSACFARPELDALRQTLSTRACREWSRSGIVPPPSTPVHGSCRYLLRWSRWELPKT